MIGNAAVAHLEELYKPIVAAAVKWHLGKSDLEPLREATSTYCTALSGYIEAALTGGVGVCG